MPRSRSPESDNQKRNPRQPQKLRNGSKNVQQKKSDADADKSRASHPWESVVGRDFSQETFDSHAALLGDSRMSQPMYTSQRAALVMHLQRTYGNPYVQRLAEHVQRQRTSSKVQQTTDAETTSSTQPDIQRQADLPGGEVDAPIERSIEQARGSGQPLSGDVRTSMEGVFGADFSNVRVHTNAESDSLNRSMNAQAFTSEQDIFFSKGAYNPNQPEGKEILAHELTHVVQQNGSEPRAKLEVSHPADRDEQEADEVGRMVVKYSDRIGPSADRLPVEQRLDHLREASSDVQRVTAKKVAWGITKGFFLSIAKAIAGPAQYIFNKPRTDKSDAWNAASDEENYGNAHLQRMAKAVIVLQEIGAIAAWVTLMTGLGSIIAAAFAPAGLAASAVLGTIATISTIVAGVIGVVTMGLSSILSIYNLVRALSAPKNSIRRKELMLVAGKDLAGAITGLLAAVGGAIGFGAIGGGTVIQSADAIGKTVAEGGLGAHAMSVGKGIISDQSFAFGTEAQSQIVDEYQTQGQENIENTMIPAHQLGEGGGEVNAFDQLQKGRGAKNKRAEMNIDVGAINETASTQMHDVNSSENDFRSVLKNKKKDTINTKRIQRAPEDESANQEDYGSQLKQELNKAGQAANSASASNANDRQSLSQEKKELDASSGDISKAEQGLNKAKGVDEMESNLEKITKESEGGEGKVNEPAEEKATKDEPQTEGEVKTKEESLLEAHETVDQIEAKSGEKFGEKKPGFLGKMVGWFKKGTKNLKKWFLSGLVALKDRVKGIFAKIKEKIAGLLIRFTDIKEPVEGLQQDVGAAKAQLPEAKSGIDDALVGIASSDSQVSELSDTVEEVKKQI